MIRLYAILLSFTWMLHGQVKINEVLFYNDPASADAFRTHQWVELYNTGTGPVDLSGWSISASDGAAGQSARMLPAVSLPAGAYLVVHFTSGDNRLDFSNNSGDYYTGDDSANTPYWSVDGDEAALYSPTGIADFLNWARSSATYQPGQANQDAVKAKIWMEGVVLRHDRIGLERLRMLRVLGAGDSLGRDPDSTDTNTVADFDAGGGVYGGGPTPGAQNLNLSALDAGESGDPQAQRVPSAGARRPAQATPAKSKWTILLYFSSDNELALPFREKLKRLEVAIASAAENLKVQVGDLGVRFVVLWNAGPVSYTLRGQAVPPEQTASGDLKLLFFPGTNGTLKITPKLNMGDREVLKDFIKWGKDNFPADHYALILSGHGAGWKGFGPDGEFPGTRQGDDTLYMDELSSAMAGQQLDWVAFDSCLMAGVEVAYQLAIYTNIQYMLASEELTTATDFPYENMVARTTQHPEWEALQSITAVYEEYRDRVSASQFRDLYTVSVTDLTQMQALTEAIHEWVVVLAPGMRLFFKRDDPKDNAQVITQAQRGATDKYYDFNFIDLYDFGDQMLSSGLPDCLVSPARAVQTAVKKAVIWESSGKVHSRAHGLHIYFPERRMLPVQVDADQLLVKAPNGMTAPFYPSIVIPTGVGPNGTIVGTYFSFFQNQPYDLPYTRLVDGNSSLAHYGENLDQLPLESRDPETNRAFDGANGTVVWPLPQSPNFSFPIESWWHAFLNEFYKPAGDLHILPLTLSNGTKVNPVERDGGPCANPYDTITVPLGTVVTLSSRGSSDPDQGAGDIAPTHYFADKDDQVGCPGCVEPQTVPKDTDAAKAKTNMDADRDIANTKTDQNDVDANVFSRVCDRLTPPIVITLMPWDDDHTYPFHNTHPSAMFVHPQSGLHKAVLNCTQPSTGFPTSGTMTLVLTVTSDPYRSAGFILIDGVPLMVGFTTTGLPTSPNTSKAPSTINLRGDRPAIPNGSGTYDPATGAWSATILATDRIAGFPNVQVKWVNMQFNKDGTVTGTYQVGTNGNLNNEDQPVTYKVTGKWTGN